jgi:hypothetical protein
MKFTGEFKSLCKKGYTFQKLYANNYKCYHKKHIKEGLHFWIWVADGGYIELNDWYNHTEAIVNLIKSIDWSKQELQKSIFGDYKRVYIRFNHNNSKAGYEIADKGFDIEQFVYMRNNNVSMEVAYEKINEKYDREIYISEESANVLLNELSLIQSN